MELKTWLLIAAKEGNPSILVFEVKSFESKRRFIGVVEGGDIRVGHVVAPGIVVCGGQLQAVALLAAVALGTPVSRCHVPVNVPLSSTSSQSV